MESINRNSTRLMATLQGFGLQLGCSCIPWSETEMDEDLVGRAGLDLATLRLKVRARRFQDSLWFTNGVHRLGISSRCGSCFEYFDREL